MCLCKKNFYVFVPFWLSCGETASDQNMLVGFVYFSTHHQPRFQTPAPIFPPPQQTNRNSLCITPTDYDTLVVDRRTNHSVALHSGLTPDTPRRHNGYQQTQQRKTIPSPSQEADKGQPPTFICRVTDSIFNRMLISMQEAGQNPHDARRSGRRRRS